MEGKSSPWGKIDHSETVVEGITVVNTPSHGGYKLDRKRNAKVNPAWRKAGGWYEEDCEWAVVVLTFPEHFSAELHGHAVEAAKRWDPDSYTAVTGKPVAVEESYVLQEREFVKRTKGMLVAWSAMTGETWNVPEGFVRVRATRDGVDMPRDYLIPREVYRARDGKFVFNEGDYPFFQ